MQLKRWIPRIIAIAIVAAGAAFLWVKKPWAKQPTPITYVTVPVGKGKIAAQVTANGTLSARSTTTVGAQVSGRIIELHADFNDKVTKGQVLAKLDEQLLKSQITSASAALALAKANVAKAEVAVDDADRQYKRQKTLQEQSLVAGATVEAAEVAYTTAKASLAAAKASAAQASAVLEQARTNLSYATIYSPVDGVVLSRSVEVGQTVAASMTAPELFKIAEDLKIMQINTAVSEADVGALKDGMDAQFSVDAFPGKTFKGKVRQVRNAPTTTSGVVTYDAVIDVENPELQLRPGMTANVTFVLAEVADAIKIPNSALRFKPTREQMMAIFAQSGGRPGGRGQGGGRRNREGVGSAGGSASGSGGPPPAGGPAGGGGRPDMMTGASGGRMRDFGDKKPVWKLVDNKPKMVLIKPGVTDGSATEMVEGELQPGDQLITEINGVAKPTRQMGGF
ncbi:MAG: efflux RND transporter periplasmic adaptor subunit [Kofleriaceae bacterium]|nr:efflux RND transporter periplasmic adaptor subunit [Kofleriaceae bacterium]